MPHKIIQLFAFSLLLVVFKSVYAVLPDYYAEPGINSFRDYKDGEMSDRVDPFGGGLHIQSNDIVIPINGGLDVVIKRIYRSLQGQAGVLGNSYLPGRTSTGIGWDIHFGRVWYENDLAGSTASACKVNELSASNNNPVLELKDGTRKVLVTADSADYAFITKDRWIAKCRSYGDGGGLDVYAPNGLKYVFNVVGQIGGKRAYSVSQIEDTNGNTITIQYSTSQQHSLIKHIYTSETGGSTPVASFNYINELEWDARLDNIQSFGKTWSFAYHQATTGGVNITNYYYLNSFTPPEGDPWLYTYYETTALGAAGLFSLKNITSPGGTTSEFQYAYEQFDAVFALLTSTVSQKRIFDGDVETGIWNYDYQPGPADGKDLTIVTGPDGEVRYEHWSAKISTAANIWRIGSLYSKTYIDNTDGEVHKEIYSWSPELLSSQNEKHRRTIDVSLNSYIPRLNSLTTTRDGTSYITAYTDYDAYGNAQTVTRKRTNNTNIQITRTLFDVKTTPWILHLASSKTIDTVTGDRQWSYDNKGNLLFKYGYGGVTTGYTYYTNGDLQTMTDPRGKVTKYQNYKRGIPRTEIKAFGTVDANTINRSVNHDGTLYSQTIDGRRTIYSYDDLKRITYINTPRSDDNNIRITWNRSGTRRALARGNFTEIRSLDGLGRLLRIYAEGVSLNYSYDAKGRKTFSSNPNSTSVGDTNTYDILGRLKRVTHSDNSRIDYNYGLNNVTTVTNERNKSTGYKFISFGHPDTGKFLTQVDAPEAVTTTIGRDLLGNIDYVIQGGITRDYVYDNRFYLTNITHPELGTDTDQGVYFGRDGAGNMTWRKVGLGGAQTLFTYDNLGQRDKILYPGNSTPDVDYDFYKNGKVSDVRKGNTHWHYTYDDNNILTTETLAITAPINETFTFTHQPNRNDVNISTTYPSDFSVNYTPDDLGWPQSLISYSHGIYFANQITYHPSGAVNTIQLGNNRTTTVTEDYRLRPDSVTTDGNTVSIAYGYDVGSNITSITNAINPSHGFPTIGNVPGLDYDDLDRLTHQMGTLIAGYDAGGNINFLNIGGNNLTYNYNSRNRLATVDGSFHNLAYDTYGNVINNGIDSFVYDDASHLVSVPAQGIQNIYDGNGKLTVQTKNGKNTVTLYTKNGQLLYEKDSERIREYVKLNTKLIATHDQCTENGVDDDNDGISNCYETQMGLDPNNASDAQQDNDNDGLTNLQEYQLGTKFNVADSDGDGMLDGYEVNYGLNPLANDASTDVDGDGLTNLLESQYGTNPKKSDTDGDGVSDGDEITAGTDPNLNIAALITIVNSLLLN